jgi:peptide/nickel transport system permease protein
MRGLFGRFCDRRSAVLGLVLLLVIALVDILAPVRYPLDAAEMVAPPLLWPGQRPSFPLGSDQMAGTWQPVSPVVRARPC